MKVNKEFTGKIYAIGIATGTSQNGNKYSNVLVSKEPVIRRRSNYSLYLDPEDERMMKELGNPTLSYSEDGTRKVTTFDTAKELTGEYTLARVSHAPYKVDDRIIREAFVVANETENVNSLAERAIQRGYDRATAFFKDKSFFEDYKRFVLFEITPEELEQLLQQAEELDE